MAACFCFLGWTNPAAADNYQYKMVRADQALAKLAVLTRADLRGAGGWTGGPIKPDRSESSFVCDGKKPKLSDLVVTGDAKSQFTYGGGTAVLITTSAVYRTVGMLETSWRREVQSVNLACARAMIVDEIGDKARLVSFERLAFPRIGSHTMAFRASVRYANGVSAVFDVVMFTRGRTGCTLTMGGMVTRPEDASQFVAVEKHLASILAARIAVV